MATKYVCDACGRELPIESALTPLSIGTEKLLDLCVACKSSLVHGIKSQVAEAAAERVAAAIPKPAAQPSVFREGVGSGAGVAAERLQKPSKQ